MSKKIFKRKIYIKNLKNFIDKPVIKVITGMRRVGKSYFIKQIINELYEKQISEKQILYINKENLKFNFIKNFLDLFNYVSEKFEKIEGNKYLFIDEVQEIESWEKAISSFFSEEDIDIYITGSNAHLLSSEIATLISGRYVEFNIYTLSFKEYIEFCKVNNTHAKQEIIKYMKFGGFPVLKHFDYQEDISFQYINSLYNTIVLKDIISKYNIRNIMLFENITKFIFSNIGHIFSARRISKYLKSQNISVGTDTILNYINYLVSTYMIYKVRRYDLKGKKILEIQEKYYLGDLGLKTAITGYKEDDISGVLENLVFLKLKQSNYKIFIGKLNDLEIDFVAENKNGKIYIQVAYLLKSEETIKREFGVLRKIKDNYPKYVITMDNLPQTNNDGIIRMHIFDFLMNF